MSYRWIERKLTKEHGIFSTCSTNKTDGKEYKHDWNKLSSLGSLLQSSVKNLDNHQLTAAILCTHEVFLPLKLIAWNYGYTTRAQPKIGRTKLMFSENSPSYEMPPCCNCDVIGLSNLITVPDYKQPIKFLVFVAGTCNMILLLVSNGNLTLLFFSYKWLQLKLTNHWLTRSE